MAAVLYDNVAQVAPPGGPIFFRRSHGRQVHADALAFLTGITYSPPRGRQNAQAARAAALDNDNNDDDDDGDRDPNAACVPPLVHCVYCMCSCYST
jgi:hypothetical protein